MSFGLALTHISPVVSRHCIRRSSIWDAFIFLAFFKTMMSFKQFKFKCNGKVFEFSIFEIKNELEWFKLNPFLLLFQWQKDFRWNLPYQYRPWKTELFEYWSQIGWVPRNFKIFIFKPKLSFLREKHKNDQWNEFLDFYKFTLYLIF